MSSTLELFGNQTQSTQHKVQPSKSKNKKNYQHFVKPVPLDPNFPHAYRTVLVKSVDELYNILNQPFDVMSFDTETTGLNPSRDFIVGFSFCFDGKTAYYAPVSHSIGGLGFDALRCVYARMCACKVVTTYQARFDIRMMEYAHPDNPALMLAGGTREDPAMIFDMSKVRVFDVQAALWLADTNLPFPRLKSKVNKEGVTTLMGCEERFLGWRRQDFQSTLGGATNFYFVDYNNPTTVFYAGVDALSTFKLFPIAMVYHNESKTAGQIDQQLIYPLMKMEETKLKFNNDYYTYHFDRLTKDVERLKEAIFAEVGTRFNLNSSTQRESVFLSFGIDTGVYTPKGMMSTSNKVVGEYIYQQECKGNDYPQFLKYYVEYIIKEKHRTSFYGPMSELLSKYPNGARLGYRNVNAASGRLSCGGDKDSDYFLKMNMMALPKPHTHDWFVRQADSTSDPHYTMFGYEMTYYPRPDSIGTTEGYEVPNFRNGFEMHDGWVLLARDFASQELRVCANIANEQTWIDTFNSGDDLHKIVAIQMWGEENYNRDKRKIAKAISFGILYGMSPRSFAEKNHVSLSEAEDFFNRYYRGAPNLTAWMDYTKRKAMTTGYNYTFFGRPRRFLHYLTTGKGGDVGFAKRVAVNSIIQGTSADIGRLGLIRTYKLLLTNPKFKDKVFFASMIHDEISLIVHESVLHEVDTIFQQCLNVHVSQWKCQLDTGLEIGRAWGASFNFTRTDTTFKVDINPLPDNFEALLESTKDLSMPVDSFHTSDLLDEDNSDELGGDTSLF